MSSHVCFQVQFVLQFVSCCKQARNTPLHLAALNFRAHFIPRLNAKSYSVIKYLASQPDTNLAMLNMVDILHCALY
jgi:hypothetical protein